MPVDLRVICDGLSRRSFLQLGRGRHGRRRPRRTFSRRKPVGPKRHGTQSGHPDLARRRSEPPGSLRHEARGAGRVRGIWKPIRTNVPGSRSASCSPAGPGRRQVLDRPLAASRHRRPFRRRPSHVDQPRQGSAAPIRRRFPGINAIIAASVRTANRPACRPTSPCPSPQHRPRPGYFGGNYLGRQHDPFETGGDPNAGNFRVQNLDLAANLTLERLEDRARWSRHFDQFPRDVDSARHVLDAWTASIARPTRWCRASGPRGLRHRSRRSEHCATATAATRGASRMLARRLVEAGGTFVTVHFGGWDHHWDLQSGMENYLPGRQAGRRPSSATWPSGACWTRRWS